MILRFVRLLAAGTTVMLVACGEPTDIPGNLHEQLPAGPGLTGVLWTEDGDLLSYISVMACRTDVCFYDDSGPDGRFTFLLDTPSDLLIKTAEDMSATPRRGTPMVPLSIEGNAFVDLGDVYVPLLGPGVLIHADATDRETFDAGDGLTLELVPSDLELPPGISNLAARRIPLSQVPPYPELEGEEVLAVFVLHPFAAKSTVPIGVRAELPVPEGTAVRLRTIDETDGRLSAPVPAMGQGGYVLTGPGSGIVSLTHLVVSR